MGSRMNRHALLVIDASRKPSIDWAQQIITQLKRQQNDIQISLLYILPKIPAHCLQLPSLVREQHQVYLKAYQTLQHWGEHLQIPIDAQWMLEGQFKREGTALAKKIAADLVIEGKLWDEALLEEDKEAPTLDVDLEDFCIEYSA